MDPYCMNCPNKLNYKYMGGCAGTKFGCCPNTLMYCLNKNCSNCNLHNLHFEE